MTWCPRESDLWEAIAAGRWPDVSDTDLWAHVNACATCRDVALVSASISSEGASARREAAPPTAAVVWWRAQMRARQEAARAATTPITVIQGIAIACALGLAVAVAGTAMESLHAPLAWFAAWRGAVGVSAADLAAIDVTSRSMLVPFALIVASLIFAPIAVYLITAGD